MPIRAIILGTVALLGLACLAILLVGNWSEFSSVDRFNATLGLIAFLASVAIALWPETEPDYERLTRPYVEASIELSENKAEPGSPKLKISLSNSGSLPADEVAYALIAEGQAFLPALRSSPEKTGVWTSNIAPGATIVEKDSNLIIDTARTYSNVSVSVSYTALIKGRKRQYVDTFLFKPRTDAYAGEHLPVQTKRQDGVFSDQSIAEETQARVARDTGTVSFSFLSSEQPIHDGPIILAQGGIPESGYQWGIGWIGPSNWLGVRAVPARPQSPGLTTVAPPNLPKAEHSIAMIPSSDNRKLVREIHIMLLANDSDRHDVHFTWSPETLSVKIDGRSLVYAVPSD